MTPRRGWGSALLGGLAITSGVALTALAGWLIVRAAAMPAILTLTVAMVGVRAFGLARPVLTYLQRLRSHDLALRLLAAERVAVYDAVVPLVPGALGRRRGETLAAIVDDVDAVLDHELRVRLPVRSYAVAAVILTAATIVLRPTAGVVVGLLCLTGPLLHTLARSATARAEARAVAERARLADAVVEAAQCAEELRMWHAESRVLDEVDEAGAGMSHAATRAASALGAARAAALALSGVAVGAVALGCGDAVAQRTLTGPLFALLLLVPLALAEPLSSMAESGAAAARAGAARARLDALRRRTPAVADPAEPAEAPQAPDRPELAASVTARWDGRPVLDKLRLTLRPGEKVAVVGPNGSGKSTLAGLLVRFRDPDEGAVTLGGTDVRAMSLDDVRERVGYLDDDPHVFASTVVENVRFARPGASDGDVERSLRRARLGPWLDALPDGLHTRLGDGGSEVSGGERARLAIARTMLADPPVVVMDEPVAHLDTALADRIAADVLSDTSGAVVWISHAPVDAGLVDHVIDLGGKP